LKALRFRLASLGAGLLLAGAAWAQAYPQKPITLVVPFAAGSGTDAVGRVIAQELSERLKQPVVVDNRAGANGQIGAEFVAKAPADGYTLLMTTATTHSINPGLYKLLRYDAQRDFSPIARVGMMPFALVVRSDFPANSVAALVTEARKREKGLTFASSNGTAKLVGATLGRATQGAMTEVQYKSAPQALTDLLGGHVDINFADLTTALPGIRAGQLRALGVTTAQRSALLPDVPSIDETVRGVDLASWFGIFGPARLPAQVVTQLARELQSVLQQNTVREKLAGIGFEVLPSRSAEEFSAYLNDQRTKWGASIKQAGIEPQ
jgi:tripartite-type tricarboxylate transporter receptor subunit TctC